MKLPRFVTVAALTLSAGACRGSQVAAPAEASVAFVDAGPADAGPPDVHVDESKRVGDAEAENAGLYAGMASIDGGTYEMGFNGHRVSVGGIHLDSTEVTVDAYAACVAAGKCSDNVRMQFYEGKDQGHGACNYGVAGRGNHPINCVDWNQASTYCRAQGKRLLTEEEWEWAARGEGEGRKYPWGNSDDVRACWSGSENRSGTCPVGSFPAGDAPGGLHDMAGNVLEWTSSLYDASARVIRGGSWRNPDTSILAASYRFASASAPTNRTDDVGFRCGR
jgi:sulfatase modifying factor 1